MKTSKQDSTSTIIGYVISPFIATWIYLWENYVLIRWPISYWQWVALSVAFLVACKLFKPFRYLLGAIFAAAIICQVAAWIGLLSLPIFRLK